MDINKYYIFEVSNIRYLFPRQKNLRTYFWGYKHTQPVEADLLISTVYHKKKNKRKILSLSISKLHFPWPRMLKRCGPEPNRLLQFSVTGNATAKSNGRSEDLWQIYLSEEHRSTLDSFPRAALFQCLGTYKKKKVS